MTTQYVNTENKSCHWQQQMADAFTNVEQLCRYLGISLTDLPVSTDAAKNFPFRVPLSFAASMEKGNPADPLLRQVLPVHDEMTEYPGFSNDPVGDLEAISETGVLHKYNGRVLLINTGGCAINCRYCFRRNFPYSGNQLGTQEEDAAIAYIAGHPDINEVIMSGGDPLLLNDDRLTRLLEKLAGVRNILRIRIHSRIPVVLPDRITPGLMQSLNQTEKQIIVVLHSNHANEISPAVVSACKRMKQNNFCLLNQSVLLKDVNDNAEVLGQLSEKLFAAGILPYYLHLLDKAAGTGHFEVGEPKAIALIRQIQHHLPGYLVPKLVKEEAGLLSKTLVSI